MFYIQKLNKYSSDTYKVSDTNTHWKYLQLINILHALCSCMHTSCHFLRQKYGKYIDTQFKENILLLTLVIYEGNILFTSIYLDDVMIIFECLPIVLMDISLRFKLTLSSVDGFIPQVWAIIRITGSSFNYRSLVR